MKKFPVPFSPRTISGLLLCLLLAFPGARARAEDSPGASPAPNYTLAIIPFYSPEKIWHLYTPFIAYLQAETKLPWELKLYPDHNSLIDELCHDQIGIALLGPVPVGRVQAKCGINPFLVALNPEGQPLYQSIIITGDPAVSELGDLRGKRFGFFKGSTAAHIAPMKMLMDNGLQPAIQPVFLESQDRLVSALLTKELAAAGVKESLYRKFQSEPLRVLKSSEPLPNFAFSAAPGLPAAGREQFAAALRKLQPRSNPQDAETTRGWDDEIKNGFIEANEEYLAAVRKLHQVFHEVTHED